MPKFLEKILKKGAAKAGMRSKKEIGHYVYGAMNNMGAMHGSAETSKGAAMQAKHERDHPSHHNSHQSGKSRAMAHKGKK